MSEFSLPNINNKNNNSGSKLVDAGESSSINLPPILAATGRPDVLEESNQYVPLDETVDETVDETINPQFTGPLPSKIFREPKFKSTLYPYEEETKKKNWRITPEQNMRLIKIKKLGKGGQGTTYICAIVSAENKTEEEINISVQEKIQDGSFYVVKVMDKLTRPTSDMHKINKQLNDIQREIKVLKYLKDNWFCAENTLCYRGEMEDEHRVYIFFDYDGEYTVTLDDFIEKMKASKYSEEKFTNILFTIFLNIYKNIQYIHSVGIAHYDIKPLNILVSKNNYKTKLIDFGLSCINDEHIFKIGERIRGNYQNNNDWIKGTITGINSNTNFDIQYDNGDSEKNVDINKIKQRGVLNVPCDIDMRGTFPYFDIRIFRCLTKNDRPFCNNMNFKNLKNIDLWAFGVIIYDVLFKKPPFEELDLMSKLNYLKSNDRFISPPNASDPIRNKTQYALWYLRTIQQFYELFYNLTPIFSRVRNIVESASRIYGLPEEDETQETEDKKYAENIAKKNLEFEKEIVKRADLVVFEKEKAKEEIKLTINNIKRNFSFINNLMSMFYKKNKIPDIEKMPLIEDFFKPYENDEEQYGMGRKHNSRKNKSRKNKSRKHKSRKHKSRKNKSRKNKSRKNK